MKTISLQDQDNLEILGLLFVSKLTEAEKQMWIKALLDMTGEQKLRLKKLLEEEVTYELDAKEKAIHQFLDVLKTK